MSTPLLQAARQHLSARLDGKQSPRETLHPWRKPWQFLYGHCLRVEALSLKLLAAEALALPADEVLALRLAAILHDIGRLDRPADHAAYGAELAAAWLQRPEIAAQVPQPELVLALIAGHSDKDQPESDPRHALLKDADTLDEIGAMSIFMSANWLDRSSPFFYQELLSRLKEYELPYCDRALARLNTRAGRACLQEKRRFIEGFIDQLGLELEEI